MNCQQVQARLAELVYEEAGADDRLEVQKLRQHVERCEACAAELAALRKTAGRLQAVADLDEGEGTHLAVAAVYRKSTERAARSRRRWRRAAIALSVAAAVLLVIAAVQATSLRVEVYDTHLTIGWNSPSGTSNRAGLAGREGEAPAEPRNSLPRSGSPSRSRPDGRQDSAALLAEQQRRLEELDTLVRLIAAQQTTDEREYRLLARELASRIDRVGAASDVRWRTVGRGMHNLYLANTATATASAEAPAMEIPQGESP